MILSPSQEDNMFTRKTAAESRAIHEAVRAARKEPETHSVPIESEDDAADLPDVSFAEEATEVLDTTQRDGDIFSKHDSSTKSDEPIALVEVQKTTSGFGFNIVGGVDNPHFPNDSGIFVSLVNPSSPSFGVVKTGDKILSIDGVNLTSKTHDEAVELFRGMDIGKIVKLLIDREASQKYIDSMSVRSASPPLLPINDLPSSTNSNKANGDAISHKISPFEKRNSIKSESGSLAASDSRSRLTPHGVATIVERFRGKMNGNTQLADDDDQSVTSYAPSMHSIIDDVPRTPRRPLSYLDPRNPSLFTEVLYVSIGLAAAAIGGFAIYKAVRNRF